MEATTMAEGNHAKDISEQLRELKDYWESQRLALEKRQRDVLWESRLATVICILSSIVALVAMCLAWAHR